MTLINPCAACHEREALPLTDLCGGCEEIFAADWAARVARQNRAGEADQLVSAVMLVRTEAA